MARLTCKQLNQLFAIGGLPIRIREYRIGVWEFEHTQTHQVRYDYTPALNRLTTEGWLIKAQRYLVTMEHQKTFVDTPKTPAQKKSEEFQEFFNELKGKEAHKRFMAGKLKVIDGLYAKFPKVNPPPVDRSHIKLVA